MAVEIHRVDTLAAFQEALRERRYSLILADYKVPGVDPLEALQWAQQHFAQTPLIFFSGTIGEEKAIEVLKLGASDCVSKQSLGRLDPAIRRALHEAEEQAFRKKAEEQLRIESSALQAAANAIVIADSKGVIQWVNPAFERLTGYSAAEAIGHNPRFLRSGKHPPDFYKAMWDAITAGRVWHSELVNRRKTGDLYQEEMTITPVKNDQGQITHFIAIKQDITERKRAEEQVRISEQRLGLAMDAAQAAAWEMDLATGQRLWDSRLLKLLRVSPETAAEAPQHWLDFIFPEDRDRVLAQFAAACAEGGPPYDIEYRMCRMDGVARWYASRGALHHEPDGSRRIIGVVQDITERKQREQELHAAKEQLTRANAELEDRVQERTAKLNETIGELEAFSYSLSHDMRAPLRAICGYSQIILAEHRDHLPDEVLTLIEKVSRATKRMDTLITDVLALTRLSRTEIHSEAIDAEQLIRQIVEERPEMQSPKAEVIIQSPLMLVMGDRASLAQCLANLIGNGVKFVSRGVTPQIRVWTDYEGGDSFVRLWIVDNGIGIAPESQQTIFEMFQRLHSQEEYEGTGVGLAIVRKAVERMGGRVGLESEPGKGSRFWLELPKGLTRPAV